MKKNTDNWGPSVLKMPVMQWVSKNNPDMGVVLTDTFAQTAKESGFSYVAFQFKKGEAKDLFMADSVNCTTEEFQDLIEAIKEQLIKEDK